jgi:hypothetical protein
MISFLECVFKKTMARQWWQARNAGVRYGIARVKALIYAEIKVLKVKSDDDGTRQRINELMFILAQIKKVEDYENK